MSPHRVARIVAIVIGAALLLGLEQGLGVKFYFAIPVAILGYVAVLLGAMLIFKTGTNAK